MSSDGADVTSGGKCISPWHASTAVSNHQRIVYTVSRKKMVPLIFLSRHSVAFGVILSLLFVLFVCLFVCTVEDISTQDGAIGVKFWLRVEQTS